MGDPFGAGKYQRTNQKGRLKHEILGWICCVDFRVCVFSPESTVTFVGGQQCKEEIGEAGGSGAGKARLQVGP
jgi:hypothetical protein